MKEQWQRVVNRIDNLSLRERAIIFLMAALVVVTAANMLMLDPMSIEQKRIAKRMQDEQAQIASIRAEIQQTVNERTADPNASGRERLRVLQQQVGDLRQAVAGMQSGLISPDKMAPLLEDMLRRSTRLRLVSLKKLPVSSMVEAPVEDNDQAGISIGGLYRHSVELTVKGSYFDMVSYLAELENLSSQLFWGDMAFAVGQYPEATMTLTVSTLSLDKQWLHI